MKSAAEAGSAVNARVFVAVIDPATVTDDFYAAATLLMLALIGLAWVVRRPKGPLKTVAH